MYRYYSYRTLSEYIYIYMGMGFLIGCFEHDDANLEPFTRMIFLGWCVGYYAHISPGLGFRVWPHMMLLLAVFEAEAVVFEAEAVGGRGPKNQSLGSGFTCFLFSPRMFGEMIQFQLAYFSISLRFHQLHPRNWTVRPLKIGNPNSETIVFQSSIFRGRNVKFRGV